MLIGFRHLFSIPVELQANWIFRITEQEGRKEWLRAVDRFVLWVGAAGLFLVPFPLELKLLGLARFRRVDFARNIWLALLRMCFLLLGKVALYLLAFAWEISRMAQSSPTLRSHRALNSSTQPAPRVPIQSPTI
jgi:hypothetical protein